MIEMEQNGEEVTILLSGKPLDIINQGDDFIIAECGFDDLPDEAVQRLPENLVINIHHETGFGTFFFYELDICNGEQGLALIFRCHTPNKYWEGKFGLATFINAINDQVEFFDNLIVTQIETENDWKGIKLERIISEGDPLRNSILSAASDLRALIHSTEVALSGLVWRDEYTKNEDSFCKDLLLPLLRRMRFSFVRYTHGKREYGKDFTFSELSPFGHYRHYGLQAKAGDISGGVNSAIDGLLGQINDAFAMPYYEVGSKDPRYISTFIIAISGKFTENAREKIVEKMPKGLIGSVYFLDRENIFELVERFWNSR